nr:reverse transcriptase domain-containing protein [Tanacetum cinerariifolium]
MPKYAKFLKGLLSNKTRLEEACTMTMNERCSAVLLNKLPSKEKDPGSFTIPCDIGNLHIDNALADLGSSISLMPYTMYEKLGFFQIPITLEDQEKTTFTCPYGTFVYRRMPFGLCNALATFQRCMTTIFHDMVEDFMEVFMDDFSVFDAKFDFSEYCKKAFNKLKEKLTTAPIIISPDWSVPFELMCDASDFMVGIVLGKRIEGRFKPIYYARKTLNDAQEHYTTTEKELLTVVFSFDKFRPYLILSKTVVYTDHSALKYLFSKLDAKPRLIRWVLILQGFNIKIKDKKEVENLVVDQLSRLENPNIGKLAKEEIGNKFPDVHLMILKSKLNDEEPWYADYVNYIVRKVVPPKWTPERKKRLFSQVKNYFWDEPYAFRLCSDNVMRRCIAGYEILKILARCHSGPTGGHHSASVIGRKVYEAGFYWPSIFRDAKDYVMKCEACQKSGNISSRNEMPQNNIQVYELEYGVLPSPGYGVLDLFPWSLLEVVVSAEVPVHVLDQPEHSHQLGEHPQWPQGHQPQQPTASLWRERFMNYLKEQTDGEAMINSIQNGDQPLPVIAQVSLAGNAQNAPPTLKDPNNETAKDLWDALKRQMCGSKYGGQDRKAAILYEYETFKAIEGEQLLDTYLRYLQVINDLKKCGYKKDNCELNYKFLNNLQPEWKQYGTQMRQTKNLMDINIDALYNTLKQNQSDVNDALRYKKKAVVVTSDPLALVAEKTNEGHFAKDCKKAKVKDYNYYKIKMLLAKKDSDEQVLLAEDQAWMESSSDSDWEINTNIVFMAQIEKVLSDSDENSSFAEQTIAEVAYYTSESESESEYETSKYYDNSTNYGLFVNNNDDQEIFHDAIKFASENFIENHIDSQKNYDKFEVDHNDSEEKEHLIDKLIQKFNHKIAKCHKRIEKANQQSKDLENQNKDLQEKYDVLINQVNTFEEQNNEFNEQMKMLNEKNADLLAQTEVLQYQLKMSRHLVEINNNVLRLQEKILEKETKISELEGCVSNKDVEIEKCFERLNECENKLHKIRQTNQTIRMIMPSKDTLYNGRKGIGFENPSYFEKAKDLRPSLYDEKQTSSLKPYVPTVILEKIIIDLEDEVVSLLEKEKANLKTIEPLKLKGFESSENANSESKNQSENDCQVIQKECDQVENSKVTAPVMFNLSVLQSILPISMTKTSCDSKNVENLDTFSSVRRPKHSGVIWKKKGSSNTFNVDLSYVSHLKLNKDVKRYSRKDLLSCNNSHLGETSSAYFCNDAMNVSCISRMCDLFDENNLFFFNDESVRISLVSKMPFRKKPRDSMNIVKIYLWIIDSGCSKHMTGNCALLTNFVEKFIGTVRFGNIDFTVITGYGDVAIGSMTIKKVYYVEGLGHNLFSVGQFCDK